MGERYWTPRAQSLHDRLAQATGCLGGEELDNYFWTTAAEALTARDPELMCSLFRVADVRSEISTELRFGMAMRSMERQYYDCAYAAWDDGGRCWVKDDVQTNVPDSYRAAATMRRTCDLLLSSSSEDERRLCAIMQHKATI